MRGFIKATALLSLSRASTFVIPDSSTLPSNPSLEYHPSDAFVKFDINNPDITERYPDFTFQVEGTDKACGESHILLNGLRLDSEWDGIKARGHEFLDFGGGKEAEWHIECLFDTVSGDGSNSIGDDVVHILSLRIGSSASTIQPGFTISYKQKDQPAILRFKPNYISQESANHPEIIATWRKPSLTFDPEVLDNAQRNVSPTSFGASRQQKSLGAYLQHLKVSLKKELNEVIKHFCPKTKEPFKATPPYPVHRPITPLDTTKSTSTQSNLPAAETRSLSTLETLDPSASTQNPPTFIPQTDVNIHLLKIFAGVLVLGSCITWICLRCRDPRRRAECLARREERRNKKLYRRAAQHHKIKMWFWNFRMRYGLASSESLSWDEKRTRIIQQEAILEDAAANDIRALRNARRVVSTVAAAEEGRNTFTYDSEGSERRRSVSTLPGYESDGSQPPTYDDVEGGLERIRVADGFRYVPAETEFRSDSSVVSTSPRISRDGTNSDFDEKIDPISLETAGSVIHDYEREL
ncbi:hypothetical protein ACLMJK_001800 [Lecanora helva]